MKILNKSFPINPKTNKRVRKSNEVDDDIKYVELMKKIFPEAIGIYTKMGKSNNEHNKLYISHAEVVIWNKKINKLLFDANEQFNPKILKIKKEQAGPPPVTRPSRPSRRMMRNNNNFKPNPKPLFIL